MLFALGLLYDLHAWQSESSTDAKAKGVRWKFAFTLDKNLAANIDLIQTNWNEYERVKSSSSEFSTKTRNLHEKRYKV